MVNINQGDNDYEILVDQKDHNGIETVEYEDGTQLSFWDYLREKMFGSWFEIEPK